MFMLHKYVRGNRTTHALGCEPRTSFRRHAQAEILRKTLKSTHRDEPCPHALPPRIFALQPSSNVLFISAIRSEEHTSELQSRGHLVCRLLLERKKNTSVPSVSSAVLDFATN